MTIEYSLDVWVAQQLREVEEDGASCAKIVLRSVENGTPWQTWTISRHGEHATDPAILISEMNNVLSGLAETFPVGKNLVQFIALDADGADLSRYNSQILGKNRQAAAGNLIQNEAGSAMSQTMLAFAETFRGVLAPINAQFSLAMRHQEVLQQTILGQTQFIQALQEQRIAEAQQAADEKNTGSELVEIFREQFPAVVELAKATMEARAVPSAPKNGKIPAKMKGN